MLKQIPFYRPLLFFSGGIMLEKCTHPGILFWVSLGIASTAYWIKWGTLTLPKKISNSNIIGLAICLLLLSFGGMHAAFHPPAEPLTQKSEIKPILLHLQEGKSTTRKQIRYHAQFYVREKNRWVNRGKVLCYLDSIAKQLRSSGEIILVKGQIEPLPGPSHPGGFDMKKWGVSNGIVGQVRIRQNDLVILMGKQYSQLENALAKIRNNAIGILKHNIKDPVCAGLAEAMLIGHKDDLDRQLMDAYTNTGVVHIIAISGMHLGLIYLLLDGILVLIAGKQTAARLAPYATLPILWSFSLLTGSSASIVRSAVMFSFLIFGKHLKRRNRSLNALLGSAFLMTFHDPEVLSDIGFQLSYAAVGSILLFHRRIKDSVTCIHPLLKILWEMISLTLAAQILTTPLVIFHFHRFPLLFLFANMVAVPLSSVILLMEIVLIFASTWEWMSMILGSLTELLLGWMNGFIFRLDLIQWGTLKDIHPSGMMLVLLGMFITILCRIFTKPSKSVFLIGIFACCMITALHFWEDHNTRQTRRLVILDIPRSTCILHQHGKSGILMFGGAWSSRNLKISRLLEETGVALGIQEWKLVKLPDKPLVVKANIGGNANEKQVSVSMMLLHRLSIEDITTLVKAMPAKDLLLFSNASNSVWKSHEWEKQAQRLHLRFLSNAYEGYLERRCACPNLK